MTGKRGRPRKTPEPPQPLPESLVGPSPQAVMQVTAALDKLALARDWASTIEQGGESMANLLELGTEARKAINEAGQQLEDCLSRMGFACGGWFTEAV